MKGTQMFCSTVKCGLGNYAVNIPAISSSMVPAALGMALSGWFAVVLGLGIPESAIMRFVMDCLC
jgi:hypothetical protein